ncbi:MAG: hypothetical protein AB9836_04460 [Aminipila sp.]
MSVNEKIIEFKNELGNKPSLVLNGRGYLALSEKMALIENAINGDEEIPPLLINFDESGFAYEETGQKEVFLTYVLFSQYLGVECSDKFSAEEYDFIMSTYYLSVIRELKIFIEPRYTVSMPFGKKEQTECFKRLSDIDRDFALFTKLLNREICSYVAILNDPAKRLEPIINKVSVDLIDNFMLRIAKDLTPENLQEAMNEMKKATQEINNYKANAQSGKVMTTSEVLSKKSSLK